MSDDYLFDGTGVPDPDVERLERTARPVAIERVRAADHVERHG